MRITLVAAMSQNRVIGKAGQLPWRLPADLVRFKRLTMNHVVIMGRRTFDSIATALPGRTNIVVTRQPGWNAPGVAVAHGLDDAIELGAALDASHHQRGELMVLGGAEIYRQSMMRADRLELTRVQAHIDGDAFFPEFTSPPWRLVEQHTQKADERHAHDMTFETWECDRPN